MDHTNQDIIYTTVKNAVRLLDPDFTQESRSITVKDRMSTTFHLSFTLDERTMKVSDMMPEDLDIKIFSLIAKMNNPKLKEFQIRKKSKSNISRLFKNKEGTVIDCVDPTVRSKLEMIRPQLIDFYDHAVKDKFLQSSSHEPLLHGKYSDINFPFLMYIPVNRLNVPDAFPTLTCMVTITSQHTTDQLIGMIKRFAQLASCIDS